MGGGHLIHRKNTVFQLGVHAIPVNLSNIFIKDMLLELRTYLLCILFTWLLTINMLIKSIKAKDGQQGEKNN